MRYDGYLECLQGKIILKRNKIHTSIHVQFILAGVLLNLFLAVIYQYINNGSPFIPLSQLPGFYTQGWPIMAQTFIILYLVYYTMRFFNKRFQEDPNSFRRFLEEILVILITGFLIMQIFWWIFVTYMVVPEDDMAFLQRKLKMILVIDTAFLTLVYAFMTSFRVFKFLQQKSLEVVRWEREYAQLQFEAMKNQLNPHFLFNSLNALSSLVHLDANLAEQFIDKLSRSYRYLLEQKEKDAVPLEQELKFLESFRFLAEQRFGNKLKIQADIMESSGYFLPPHSFMLLVETIIAGNTMSASRPLLIHFKKENDRVLVEYSYQPKPLLREDEEKRINELKQQLDFIGAGQITNHSTGDMHTYTIPLKRSA